ncbi:hypothetical protein EKE94_12510 [Mesobaculum littorinae]|uniref:DUF998 domain-containing protein n=1 Tax=Mesobaculum littorinae TaxID=2486419 RepID=A0A438AF98_9RHOB|nr:hypothetical protein [Mesobaculum littorinae]RVV97381.1 hypothetical protein EKE94_12510 [Mesobaculum littorinae]
MADQDRRAALRLLSALLLFDIVLIAIHVAFIATVGAPPDDLSLNSDTSVSEYGNFFKWIAIAVLLWRAGRAMPQQGYALLSGAYAILFLDDAGRLHERLGGALVDRLGVPGVAGLRAQDLGELAIWAALGVLVLTLFALAWGRSRTRVRVGQFFALFCALILVGIGLDMVHSLVAGAQPSSWLDATLAVAEDGGEMLLISATCALAYASFRAARRGRV